MLTAAPAAAQFYNNGNEPGSLRWRQIKTQDYKVIFPEGLDSLARVYAAWLERMKEPVGATAGYIPNQTDRKQLPVILHPMTSNANGMVIWTPRRMELYTTPDFSAPLPLPWEQHLVTHESRHVSQMQFSHEKPYRVWNILFGQLFAGAMDIVYAGLPFYEGDAVSAETELNIAGRGRNGEFLEYYRTAFREDDMRNWYQWRYGSLRKYAPDYYTVGYITAAGMRTLYDAPDFTAQYYRRIFRKKGWPFPLFNYQKTVKDVSGKRFREAFTEISDTLRQRWGREEEARAPFQPSERLVRKGRHYQSYTGTCVLDSMLYSVRRGMADAPQLVCLAPGDSVPRVLGQFAYNTSQLKPGAGGRLWWSEVVSDTRWEMVSFSEVWSADSQGARKCLKRRTRWFNPSPSPDGKRLSVTEYPVMGGSALLIVDAATGAVIERFDAPAGMQLVESEWLGGELYACAVTASGQGLYSVREGFRQVLDCGASVVKQLFAHDGALYFVSDLNGVDELYRFEPYSGKAFRVSNTPVGATWFCFATDGSLVYSMPATDGRFLSSTPASALPAPAAADFGNRHKYAFAEEVIAGGPGVVEAAGSIDGVEVPETQRYSKLAGAFRFHSWAPVYVDYDAIANLSFETLLTSAGLGATAFFQNELNTLQGCVAYNAAYSDHWTHKAETKMTYKGLYPVIEGSFSVNTDAPRWYFLQYSFPNLSKPALGNEVLGGLPSVNAYVKAYLPMGFHSGGWRRGIIPQVQWSLSNSMITRGNTAFMNRVSASIRGYVIQSRPELCIYPKLGIGAEAGWSGRPGAMAIFNPNAYFYTYGYLPGLMDTHGIRLSAMLQMPQGNAPFVERYASVMPRGMGKYTKLTNQAAAYPFQSRFTFDYAFPFAPLDWSGLGPVAYVRNLECTLHGDYGWFGGAKKTASMHLGGVGADLCVVLGNLLWIPYTTHVGVKYYYNFGIPDDLNPHQFDVVFSVDL